MSEVRIVSRYSDGATFWIQDGHVYCWERGDAGPIVVTPPGITPRMLLTRLDGVWCYGEEEEPPLATHTT